MSTNHLNSTDLKYGNVNSTGQKPVADSFDVINTDGDEVRVLRGDGQSTEGVFDSVRDISVGVSKGLDSGIEGSGEGGVSGSSKAVMKGENLLYSGVVGTDDGSNLVESLDWVMKAAELLVNDGEVAEGLGLRFKDDLANVRTLGGSSLGVFKDQSWYTTVGQGLGPLGDISSRQSGDLATVISHKPVGSSRCLQGAGVSYDSIIQDFFAQSHFNIPINKEEAVNHQHLKDTNISKVDTSENNGIISNGVSPCPSNGNQDILKRSENIENPKDSRMKKARETLSKSGYCVSDLVWGKITSHPWWPGQIFDPLDASEISMKHFKDKRLIIAYFGDGTFAWNESAKLKPFGAHFLQMEKQSNLDAFRLAVDCALDEVSERINYSLSCPCLTDGLYDNLKFQTIRNTGVCTESRTRETCDEYSNATVFEPGKLVDYVKRLAVSGVVDRLDVVIAHAQLLSFYRFKGYSQLPEFEMFGAVLDNETNVLSTMKKRRQSTVIDDGDDDDPEFQVAEQFLDTETGVLNTKKRRRQSRVIYDADDDDPEFKVAERGGSSRKRGRGSRDRTSSGKKKKSRLNLMAGNFGSTSDLSTSTSESKESTDIAKNSKRKQGETSVNTGKLVNAEVTVPSDQEFIKDSYWTDMVIKDKAEDQVLPEDQKTNDGITEVNHTDEKSKEESRPTALVLNFTDVDSVPSATNLIKIFSVYGPLIESKTEVQKNTRRAKVVFENHSNAEVAFSSAGKYSIFGPSLVSYRLKYLPLSPKRLSARVAKRGGKSFMEGDTI